MKIGAKWIVVDLFFFPGLFSTTLFERSLHTNPLELEGVLIVLQSH